jgi:hypothetical protein
MSLRTLVLLGAAVGVSGAAALYIALSSSASQDDDAVESGLALTAQITGLVRLAPDVQSAQAVVRVDDCNSVLVQITTIQAGLYTAVPAPGGQLIDAETVGGFGGEFATMPGGDSPFLPFLPTSEEGVRYHYRFPALGPGDYTLLFDGGGQIQRETPVVWQVSTDSPVRATFLVTEPTTVRGRPAVLSAALFEGQQPLLGATVVAEVIDPQGAVTQVSLLDNGQDGDYENGDGVYSALVASDQEGTFLARAHITGNTSQSTPFIRQGATEWRVGPRSATFTGAFTEACVDFNGDGFYEYLAVRGEVDVQTAGTFQLYVRLEDRTGRDMRGVSLMEPLTPGTHTIEAAIPAGDLLFDIVPPAPPGGDPVPVSPPYTLREAELTWWPGDDQPVDVDRLTGLTQGFQGCPSNLLQRPFLEIVGPCQYRGVDTNSNGKYDQLEVDLPVRVRRSGTYRFAVELRDADWYEIGWIQGSQELSSNSVQLVHMVFDARPAGRRCAHGPFMLETFTIRLDLGNGQYGGSELIGKPCEFGPELQPLQFEGVTDCNGNSVADCEELEGSDCNRNRIRDDCEENWQTDCNENGILDICEGHLDCNSNGMPDECEPDYADCNGNGIPDTCELEYDCNYDGIPDFCQDIYATRRGDEPCEALQDSDCNDNGIPDTCDMKWGGRLTDCNGNGIPDPCEVLCGLCEDENGNGRCDECE